MSKIYIDPLNLGPILIDTDDMSQCEPYKLGSNWGGWQPYHNKIDWYEIHKDRIPTPQCRKASREYMTNRVVSEETRQKLSNYWKGKPQPQLQKSNYTKHHCPVHNKWMNIGNLMRYHRECIK